MPSSYALEGREPGHLDRRVVIVVTCGAHALGVSIFNYPLAEMHASTSIWGLVPGRFRQRCSCSSQVYPLYWLRICWNVPLHRCSCRVSLPFHASCLLWGNIYHCFLVFVVCVRACRPFIKSLSPSCLPLLRFRLHTSTSLAFWRRRPSGLSLLCNIPYSPSQHRLKHIAVSVQWKQSKRADSSPPR